MNGTRHQSLFFVNLPELQKLCAVKVTLNSKLAENEIRNTQMKICRQLLFLHQDILSSPVPGTLNQISVVMAISFYKTGKCQAYVEKHGATIEAPERVGPAILQPCLCYTLITRLAPSWNKAGHLLSGFGFDFISVMDLNVSETQLCISVEACTIRLPPPKLEDFDISANILEIFDNNKNTVIQRHSILSNWCYVLPSMKMGQIISISHIIPPESPFHSYKDFQMHWKNLYGYILPEDHGETKIYCSVYFKLIGERYPLSCIRSQPVQYFNRIDLEGVLNSFLSDLKSKLPHLCGFPVKMTSKALYATKELIKHPITLQEYKINAKPANLTGKPICKGSLTQVPPRRETLQQTSSKGSSRISHRMELLINQPKQCIFSNLIRCPEDSVAEAMKKTVHSRQQQQTPGASGVPGHSNESLRMSKNSSVDSQRNNATRIIPIFKGKLLQMDVKATRANEGKKKVSVLQHSPKVVRDVTMSKLTVCNPSVNQVYKPVQIVSFKNPTNGTIAQRMTGKTSVKSGRSVCDQKKETSKQLTNSAFSNSPSSGRNSSRGKPEKINYSSLSANDKSVFQISNANLGLKKPALLSSTTKKEGKLSNQNTTKILGESRSSKKVHIQISESNKEIVNTSVSQHQTKSPTEGAGLNILRLVLNSTVHRAKREEHQQSLIPSKEYITKTTSHHSQVNYEQKSCGKRRQVKDSLTSRH
uniref:Chromosome 18 open reading frame 63 n=1 Tax=Chelonoidis abingdonii TaxID=106734 RepID=A0A8C0JEP5_CHEAB